MRIRRMQIAMVAIAAGLGTSAHAGEWLAGTASEAEIAAMMATAQPMPLPRMERAPREANRWIRTMEARSGPLPQVHVDGADDAGNVGTGNGDLGIGNGDEGANGDVGAPAWPETRATQDVEADYQIVPRDYGADNLDTIYHYSDSLVGTTTQRRTPYRKTGWFVFETASGSTARCTAQVIARSILITAGHCVHEGGNGAAGWIRKGVYTPSYDRGNAPFGQAPAVYVDTTAGWFSQGRLDEGYDVGIVVLDKLTGTNQEVGDRTGWYGFCFANCLQDLWYLTQLGYPGNYYGGQRMTEGQHLEVSDTRDYLHGSGMEGGSSGGGHIGNFNKLAEVSPGSRGQFPPRNIVFAVTSWGFTDQTLKMQGASSLSGPNNSNDFPTIYNDACTVAREIHGAGTCSFI